MPTEQSYDEVVAYETFQRYQYPQKLTLKNRLIASGLSFRQINLLFGNGVWEGIIHHLVLSSPYSDTDARRLRRIAVNDSDEDGNSVISNLIGQPYNDEIAAAVMVLTTTHIQILEGRVDVLGFTGPRQVRRPRPPGRSVPRASADPVAGRGNLHPAGFFPPRREPSSYGLLEEHGSDFRVDIPAGPFGGQPALPPSADSDDDSSRSDFESAGSVIAPRAARPADDLLARRIAQNVPEFAASLLVDRLSPASVSSQAGNPHALYGQRPRLSAELTNLQFTEELLARWTRPPQQFVDFSPDHRTALVRLRTNHQLSVQDAIAEIDQLTGEQCNELTNFYSDGLRGEHLRHLNGWEYEQFGHYFNSRDILNNLIVLIRLGASIEQAVLSVCTVDNYGIEPLSL